MYFVNRMEQCLCTVVISTEVDWLAAGKMAAEGGEAMQRFRQFAIMVAVAKNGAIGNEGQIPWPRLQ